MKRTILAALLAVLLLGTDAQAFIKWQGGAERPQSEEWAKASCAAPERVQQVTAPVLAGLRSYRIEVRDGDDSYGERCELAQGNASSSDINRVGGKKVLFHTGDTLVSALGIYIPDPGFTFGCGQPNVNEPCDGGLGTQEKQLGSCGVPVLGTLLRANAIEVRVSGGPECGSDNRLYTIFSTPMVRNRWVKLVRLIHFDIDGDGYYQLWVDDDGDSTNDFRPVPPTGARGSVVGNRLYTHTQKYPTDHPLPACPTYVPACSHARIGIYRDPDVTGTSVAYFDSYTVGHQLGEVMAAAFPSL